MSTDFNACSLTFDIIYFLISGFIKIQVAKDTNAIIVYTLIKPEIKKYMISKVNEHALKSFNFGFY
jgi:hypothetical protein